MRRGEPETGRRSEVQAEGRCACGRVRLEIDVPAVWAWHDHAESTRRASGGAYATYVGSWKSRFRILEGEEHIARWKDEKTGTTRSFCQTCGTPLMYERPRSPKMVNIPRGIFESRTGREPRYHMNLPQMADWTYLGEPLGPLKGYPGVMWERPRKSRRRDPGGML